MNSHSFGRDYVDPLTLSGIEVHKGASRIDMPSGGIGGSVNLRTLAPSDLLQGGKTLAGRALGVQRKPGPHCGRSSGRPGLGSVAMVVLAQW